MGAHGVNRYYLKRDPPLFSSEKLRELLAKRARFIYVACYNKSLERVLANFRTGLSGKIILVIGIVFIVTGLGLGIFTGFNILMRQQALSDASLSVGERWRIEGSLQWWRDLSARLSYPLAVELFIGGLILMLTTLNEVTSARSSKAERRRLKRKELIRAVITLEWLNEKKE